MDTHNLTLRAGQTGIIRFTEITGYDTPPALIGAVEVHGKARMMDVDPVSNTLTIHPLPPGIWIAEVRADGATAIYARVRVMESPLCSEAGAVVWEGALNKGAQDVLTATLEMRQGPQGVSAYEAAKRAGYEGTEAQFGADLATSATAYTEAVASAQAAATSAGDAHDYADSAQQWGERAQTQATESASWAARANTAAGNASTAATNAATSATTAAEHAGAAGNSAQAAANSAADASAAESAASSSASAAASAAESATSASAAGADHVAAAALSAAQAAETQRQIAEASADYAAHMADERVHVTATEHQHLQRLIAEFPAINPDTPGTPTPTLPDEAMTWDAIEAYISANAQPGTSTAPSRVYVSRVPWARKEESGWVNNAAAVDELVFSAKRKFMDNAPNDVKKDHACSTDATVGADDYVGKEWAFFWQHGNYMTDAFGNKHITAIKGQVVNGASFDTSRPVCAFGPRFWFFVCLERWLNPETGQWTTADGTADGVPLFQLWGISSRRWDELDDERRAELEAHGVTADDFHIWPECKVWDATEQGMVERPYWCHSAYCGAYEIDGDGAAHFVSKPGLPVWNNLCHNTIQDKYGWKAGFGGSACVQGFGVLFDIVKNATKNSQNIHAGMNSNNCSAVTAAATTAEAGYIFPISSQGNFRVGCTVWLNRSSYGSTNTPLGQSLSVQIGRITAIETRTFIDANGEEQSKMCLVFDPSQVQAFMVRTTATDCASLEGAYAHCHATQGIAMTGETDAVQGKHDGSRTSYSDGKHPYRVQGTEYMPGVWICAADTQAVKGNGSTAVTIRGVTSIPTSSQYVILHAGQRAARRSSGSLQNYLDGGYEPVGISPATGGYIVNVEMSDTGVVYPVGNAGTGASTGTGHGDNMWVGASPAEFLSGGSLNAGADAGSAALYLTNGLATAYWGIGGRD